MWPNIRTPLVWDPSAILTYLTSSTLFVLIAPGAGLRGTAQTGTTGWPKIVYTMLAMGWEGNPRQWKLQIIAGVLLSALILPVFVSVHSIVSWDFGMAGSHQVVAQHGVRALPSWSARSTPACPRWCSP